MGQAFQFLDIIIFALLAAFLVMRLRSVLGRRTGHERRPPEDTFGRAKKVEGSEKRDEKVVRLSGHDATEASREPVDVEQTDALAAGLAKILHADRKFDLDRFMAGASQAFDMIVVSYASGDTDTLKPLLSEDVFDNFARVISERESEGWVLETTLVGTRSVEAIEASMSRTVASVTVKFVSEQINVTRNENDEIVEGDATRVANVTDIWTFARDTVSRNPNWLLVATGAPN